MIDLQDRNYCPSIEEIGEFVHNPVFGQFCQEIRDVYECTEKIEYSLCSMEKGWNVKFKKAGKALCTIYPKEGYFRTMVVVGPKEKEPVERILPECSAELRDIYRRTPEGRGMRWLMLELEDRDDLYRDVLRLISIRRSGKA